MDGDVAVLFCCTVVRLQAGARLDPLDANYRQRGHSQGLEPSNLLLRSRVQSVRPVRPSLFLQVRVHGVSEQDAQVRWRPTSL